MSGATVATTLYAQAAPVPSGTCEPQTVTSDVIDTTSTGGRSYDVRLTSEDSGEPIAFSVFEPDEIGRMSIFDLGARSRSLGSGQARTITLDPPVLPGNTDVERRLTAIEETLAKLVPPAPPENPKEDPPVDHEEEYATDVVQGLLSAIKL